jgi:hypothetical protein
MTVHDCNCEKVARDWERHAESCPEWDNTRSGRLRRENEGMVALIQAYQDRCPCIPPAPCPLCERASEFL